LKFSIIPPTQGMKAFYQCKKCHKIFLAVIPVLDFFGLAIKCPHCGSLFVERDIRVVY